MKKIIFLTIDSIRYDYFVGGNTALQGGSITPKLDKWSDGFFHFTRAFSPGPSTGLTFPALLSGSFSSSFREKYGLSNKRKMIAEYMREAGFTTCAFNSNPYLTSAFKYDRGFDYFFDDFIFQGTKTVHTVFKKLHLRFRSLFKEPYWTAAAMNKSISSWVEKHKNEQFFLWVHYMDVHGPYISKKGNSFIARLKANMLWQNATRSPKSITPKEQKILVDTYIEEIRAFDEELSALIKKFPDDAMIVITGDHGEFLGERGEFAHNGLLYNKLLHVPLLIKYPTKTLPPVKLDMPLSTMDIVPSLIECIGGKKDELVDGISFLPILNGDTAPKRDKIISEEGSYHLSIINHPWKLIANYRTNTFELYNLDNDPEEEHNLQSSEPDVFQKLKKHIEEHRKKMTIRREGIDEDEQSDNISKNEELVKRMRQLGYMK